MSVLLALIASPKEKALIESLERGCLPYLSSNFFHKASCFVLENNVKRSEINRLVRDSIGFLTGHKFILPPFAHWDEATWRNLSSGCDEIVECALGWDITDFGSGDFQRIGLIMFTLRNGCLKNEKYAKPYAEKVLITQEEQVTPFHFHWKKMEDIINRGGGNLLVQVYNATADGDFDQTPVNVSLDGRRQFVNAGAILRLKPGESITLPPGQYHKFWGEKNTGPVFLGEVSTVNDDTVDNRFYEPVGRFPDIDEDEKPTHLLSIEYKQAFIRQP